MGDIGSRPTDLAIRVEEKLLAIEEKRVTQKRLALELLRCEQRTHDFRASIADIDRQITEVDTQDLASLREAHKAALAAASAEATNNG